MAWEVDHWIQPRPCQAVTARYPILLTYLHTLVLCRIISQEACNTASRVGTRYFSKDWEGRLWRHRRDPRGAFQRWTGPKRATVFCQGKRAAMGPSNWATGVAFSSNWTWCVVCCGVLSLALRRLLRRIMVGGKSWPRLARSKQVFVLGTYLGIDSH